MGIPFTTNVFLQFTVYVSGYKARCDTKSLVSGRVTLRRFCDKWRRAVWDILASSLELCSHLPSTFASNFRNGFYGNKWWCSYLTFAFDGNDQRKMQRQTFARFIRTVCNMRRIRWSCDGSYICTQRIHWISFEAFIAEAYVQLATTGCAMLKPYALRLPTATAAPLLIS